MKIAMIIDAWHPIIGGSQTHVWELSSRLVEDYNCKVDIFTRALKDDTGETLKSNEEFFNGKLRVFRLAPTTTLANLCGRILTLITIPLGIVKENKRNSYDLIHAHSILGGLMGKIAKYLTGLPLIFTVHGAPNMGSGKKGLDYFVEKWILTKIRYDNVVSAGKGFLVYPNVNRGIRVIPNGVDIDRFERNKGTAKADFFKILFVGRLDWIKGIDTLIYAIKILRNKNIPLIEKKKLQVHLIGYGFDRAKYEEMTIRHGLQDLIHFRGRIAGDELAREYSGSHLFVLPSLCEGQPITILEAMAAALPVLTTYDADNSEIVSGKAGWKVARNSASEMADTIEKILSLPETELAAMGKEAKRIVGKDYSWDMLAEKNLEIYRSITG